MSGPGASGVAGRMDEVQRRNGQFGQFDADCWQSEPVCWQLGPAPGLQRLQIAFHLKIYLGLAAGCSVNSAQSNLIHESLCWVLITVGTMSDQSGSKTGSGGSASDNDISCQYCYQQHFQLELRRVLVNSWYDRRRILLQLLLWQCLTNMRCNDWSVIHGIYTGDVHWHDLVCHVWGPIF